MDSFHDNLKAYKEFEKNFKAHPQADEQLAAYSAQTQKIAAKYYEDELQKLLEQHSKGFY